MKTDAAKRAEQAEEFDLRIERMLDLSSTIPHLYDLFRIPDELDDFLEDNYEAKQRHPSVAPLFARLDKLDEDDWSEPDVIADLWLHAGPAASELLLVQVATPIREYVSENAWRSSWGYYNTKWVAAASLHEAWDLAVEWAKERHAAAFRKYQETAHG